MKSLPAQTSGADHIPKLKIILSHFQKASRLGYIFTKGGGGLRQETIIQITKNGQIYQTTKSECCFPSIYYNKTQVCKKHADSVARNWTLAEIKEDQATEIY